MEREDLLFNKIKQANERLKLLKAQGESSNNKTLKNVRIRRNNNIKELVDLLHLETDCYDSLQLLKGGKK